MTLLHRSRVAPYVIIVHCVHAVSIIMLAFAFMGLDWLLSSLVLVRNLSFV